MLRSTKKSYLGKIFIYMKSRKYCKKVHDIFVDLQMQKRIVTKDSIFALESSNLSKKHEKLSIF